MRPPGLVTRAYLRRAAVVWFTMRLVVSAVLLFGSINPFRTPAPTMLEIAGFNVALMLVDIHRRHERPLIANLGIGRLAIFAIAAIPALAGEIALRALYAIAI